MGGECVFDECKEFVDQGVMFVFEQVGVVVGGFEVGFVGEQCGVGGVDLFCYLCLFFLLVVMVEGWEVMVKVFCYVFLIFSFLDVVVFVFLYFVYFGVVVFVDGVFGQMGELVLWQFGQNVLGDGQ